MRASELLNKLTLGNKLFVIGLAVSLCSTVQAEELADANRPLSDIQHQDNRCDTSKSNWRTAQTDFTKACSKAGLSGRAESCKKQLERCEETNHRGTRCIGNATSRDDHREDLREKREQERELQDRKDDLLADYQDNQNQVQKAKEAQDQIAQSLRAQLTGIENAKVQRQLQLETDLQNIVDLTANTQDDIDRAELELQKFVVDNDIACREKALEEKKRYVQMTRGRKLTVNQIFGRTGLSVNQAGSIRYEKVLSNCKAAYTSTGKITGFGSQYNLKQKEIKLKKDILRRQKRELAKSRIRAVKNAQQNIQALDVQKREVFKTTQTANMRAQENVILLGTQSNTILAQISEVNGKMRAAERSSTTSEIMALAALGWDTLKGRRNTGSGANKVAKQEKIEAYNEAFALMDAADNLESDKDDICKIQKEGDEISKAIAELDVDLLPEDDDTTAIATEISEEDRAPAAATGGETLSR